VDFLWGPIAECRVETSSVVAEFDVSHQVFAGVFPGRVLGAVDPLVLQSGEE